MVPISTRTELDPGLSQKEKSLGVRPSSPVQPLCVEERPINKTEE